MRLLVGLLLVLAPSFAFADKSFNTGKGATWDCAKDPVVHINTGGGHYTFTGTCTEIHVNSGNNTIEIDSVTDLHVNGGHNTVTIATAAGEIHVNGASNKVEWANGSPKVHTNGADNQVQRRAPSPAK